jgi:hypothetical protein
MRAHTENRQPYTNTKMETTCTSEMSAMSHPHAITTQEWN